MIKRIAHVCIGAVDMDETEEFYCDILGLQKLFSFTQEDEIKGFYLKVGEDSFIEVFPVEKKESTPYIKHFCLEVDDIDELIKKVRLKGWDISEKSRASAGNWQCWANDPNGVKIEFQEYTPDCSQKTGEDCEVKW